MNRSILIYTLGIHIEKRAAEKKILLHKKIQSIGSDPEKAAAAVDLVYVHDTDPGIRRKRKGKGFSYILRKKPVKDISVIERIKSLVLPPAWENVWICALPNGHLQATGNDVKRRKQYRYHPHWIALRSTTKFYQLYAFGKTLPKIRKRLGKDISAQGLPPEKVLALVVNLMEVTSIRIGSNFYEKLYGSFGLSTLKDKHVNISGSHVRFVFTGKKGVEHTISIRSKKIADLVKKCRDIPGKDLFQYYDIDGKRKLIDSGMVNAYIKEISEGDFSAKDFRTWAGTVHACLALHEAGGFSTETEKNKKIVAALDTVAAHLGNSRAVCRKYYVHPVILDLYEKEKLDSYFPKKSMRRTLKNGLYPEERIILNILEKETR